MDITVPGSFPLGDFRRSAWRLYDPLQRNNHFDWSWQAVRHRYRSCAEANDDFKALLANPSDMWEAGWGDEELTYELERCIYVFFMSGLSVFDSFAFCLYYFGHALDAGAFPLITTPSATHAMTKNIERALGHNGAAGAGDSYSPQPTLVLIRARRGAWVRGHVQVSDDVVSAAIPVQEFARIVPLGPPVPAEGACDGPKQQGKGQR